MSQKEKISYFDFMNCLKEYLNALIVFCNYYHFGQASKEYRLSCLAKKYFKRWFPNYKIKKDLFELDKLECLIYYSFVKKYGANGM